MTVGVLETEGVGGRSIAEYRQLVSTTGCARFLDLYCFWGRKQSAALIEGGVISASIAAVTGCPRYDFCAPPRSEEHTSELQSLMRISYAVFCLKKKKNPYMTT